MKAISLHQPYALAAVIGLKRFETRSWFTNHLGPLAIHSTKKRSPALRKTFEEWMQNDVIRLYFEQAVTFAFDDLHFGMVLGSVNVDLCVDADLLQVDKTECLLGDFSPNRYAWRLTQPHRLTRALECRGFQGLWNLPPDIEKSLLSR